ncbi:MAG: 23S rRNA (uracil-5-)-methyltransferase RumA [Candidatus Raymondbacteria bacterium RifOxyC12_full_50_8]|uniref:23S rRNA (Uracil-5-)-methyltransferase RumA n=1 Tax=Candidatus Raymondbacteria bacterium RIFOXYD12_FULL_49_13 TaxID=1817890 RepID=A0A1F7FJJ2_UNCRA|nr:MAG: 23S rRNA (uracil-5-)-methyltransferase RumA [Candidatus Raymondbacteria bacterium RifOxyB12_full_50_8]OGJ91975.1 MAG: 23S rRNA (uracil-5-)-methyltransferase RumA [Candidatus Raymondbacteria bacterium RIFOXYA2_FULL_49_16]OGJ96357.1 MAG: 23S rRNA (uracil-5-)-methyltransferase RumA [Candidatus Raymondbacteria bacterium RIFOXYC2_FULL_50_21]OGK03708.1 MAG: 23S rRNA (uracil-5-)-methyltransferase RumA [Candidatus Raymondbacteria bacterium RifOxyC12_full_50_8]OGK06894.1 MAG: 23S rRNA (uracil-5-
MKSMEKAIEIIVDRMALAGEGVGRINTIPVFVAGALSGERVRARITERKKSYMRGQTMEILSPSADRVSPACPVYGMCGGCNVMHLAYGAQVQYKKQLVCEAMQRIGGFSSIPVNECIASPHEFGYRNKIQVPIREKKRRLVMGFFAQNSHDVVPVASCPVHCEQGNRVYGVVRDMVTRSGIHAYSEQAHTGVLRHVLVRTARFTGESLVCLISMAPSGQRLEQLARALCAKCPGVKGVVLNINKTRGNVILGQATYQLAGQPYVTEEIEGLRFRITAPSFFQINSAQITVMHSIIAGFLKEHACETLVDAYCGVGVFSLLLSRTAKQVIGIESVSEAIRDARLNASLNNINNTEFIQGFVENEIHKIKDIDAVILNPPRTGCEGSVLHALGKAKPGKIVYVSCNPATLARDLKIITDSGYKIMLVQPVDMFPQTAHVETIVGLTLK